MDFVSGAFGCCAEFFEEFGIIPVFSKKNCSLRMLEYSLSYSVFTDYILFNDYSSHFNTNTQVLTGGSR